MRKKLFAALLLFIFMVQCIGTLNVLAQSRLSVVNTDISVKSSEYDEEIDDGDTFSITLYISNTSGEVINDVHIAVDTSSAFFIPSHLDQTVEIGSIPVDGTENQDITLQYKGTGNELVLNITYNKKIDETTSETLSTTAVLYFNVDTDDDDSKSERRTTDTTKYKPKLVIPGNEKMPFAAAGYKVRIPVNIENDSPYSAEYVVVSLVPGESAPFTSNMIKPSVTIEKIKARSSETAFFEFNVDPAALPGIYPLDVKISYENAYGDTFADINDTIHVNVKSFNTPPKLLVSKIEATPQVIKPGDKVRLKFELKNEGTLEAKDVKIGLTGLKGDGFVIDKGIPEKYFDGIPGGKVHVVEFDLICSSKMPDGYHELGITYEYKDSNGNEESNSSQVFLPVAKSGDMSKLDDGEEEPVKTVPRLIIEKYSLSSPAVKAGSKIGVNLSFLNTSRETSIRNLKVSFMSEDGVFTTEGSNSLFVRKVGPDSGFKKEISVFSKPDAQPKIYTLTINFEYEDDKGNQYTSKEFISIPVEQDCKLVLGDLNTSPENFVGQPVPMFIEFYNMGKATLYNLMIKVEGDFEGPKPSYFVGNFESGRSDSFDANIVINKPGEVKGKVLFTFEDVSGNPTELSKEFVLNIREVPPPPNMEERMNPDTKPPGSPDKDKQVWIWAGSIAGVIIIIVVIILLRKRRIRKESMMFDDIV